MAQQEPSRTRSITFSSAAAITPLSSHEYKGNVHADYSYGTVAHGGFLISLVWQAVSAHFATTLAKYQQPDTLSLHVEFLRPAGLGEVRLKVKDVRLGKGSSIVGVNLVQGGKDVVVGFVTNINRKVSRGITLPTGYSALPSLPPINFQALHANTDPNWILYSVLHWPQGSPNLALSNVKLGMRRTPSPDPCINEHWITCSHPTERWHTDMLAQVLDQGIPPMENLFPDSEQAIKRLVANAMKWHRDGPPGRENHPKWDSPRFYRTVSMTIEVKRELPAEGAEWLYMRFVTKAVDNGRLDMVAEAWDVEGNLVATAQGLWVVADIGKMALVIQKEEQEKQKVESKM